MKPHTSIEKEVDKMIPWVQPLTNEQVENLSEKAFASDFLTYAQKDKMTCMHCGETFSVYGDDMKCPHCGHTIKIEKSRKYTQHLAAYVCLSQQFNDDWQVFRYFQFHTRCRRGQKPRYDYFECWQKWLSSSGEYVLAALPRQMGWIYDNWKRSSEITIKRSYRNYCGNDYSSWPGYYTEVESVIPNIRRNGFEGDSFDIPEWELFSGILNTPMIETLFKAGKYSMVKALIGTKITDNIMAAVKIMLRNHYVVTDARLWLDYIDIISKLNLDVHNAHYVCPDNLLMAHDEMHKRLERKVEVDKIELRREEALRQDEAYIKSHERFFDLDITNGILHVRPLKSVLEFLEEGTHMHHCVYDCGYYKKLNHLILSAKINSKRIETVDVNLNTYEIEQSYGVQNKLTPFHDAIIGLVNEHMGEIKALNSGAKTLAIAI